MPDLNTITSPVVGRAAEVEQLPMNEDHKRTSVAHWLVNAQGLHPLFTQWVFSAIHLGHVDGYPPAVLHFPGATHEVVLLAVDPDFPVTAEAVMDPEWVLHPLTPVNLAHQFEATDAEMELVLRGMAYAIAHGVMPPEPWYGYESFRESWLEVIVKTLAHIRGEAHAS